MKLVVGLGNPGDKYKTTRHNVGFLAIEYILKSEGYNEQAKSLLISLGEDKAAMLKPQDYMNNSGRAVAEACRFYKIDISRDLLIIHDEVDLPFGELRLSKNSSPAGHNGVKSIIQELGTQDFNRLRVGIEARDSRIEKPTDMFVLENFTQEEQDTLHQTLLTQVKDEVEKFIHQ